MTSRPPRTLNLSAKRRALYQALSGSHDPATPATPRPADDGPAPLSFSQERLWFLDRFQPGVAVYNMPFSIRIAPPCRIAAAEQALTEIVRRHDVLRTTFPAVDGRPVQAVAPAGPIALPVVDLRAVPEAARGAVLDRLFKEEWTHVFDLAHGPLFRARLIRVDGHDHVLLLNMHHIVSDGWSLGVFLREFSVLYDAFSAGRPSPLPELAVRYADYARDQRRRLTDAALADAMAYWRAQLAGAPTILELPLDRPRPSEQTFRGETQFFAIPPDVVSGLSALARRTGATLFMVVLAAWKALLFRYTGRPDIVVGTPIANRHRTELEQLIGFFVNTLVLRTSLAGDLTFLELVARVREVTLGAYAHQELPFEKLVEELQPERHLNHNPLFQVMFALQNAPTTGRDAITRAADPGGAPVTIASAAKFDVSMFLGEGPAGLSGELEYNTDLFDTATATRMIGHYRELLAGVAARPEQCLAELPLFTAAERRQILSQWSGGEPGRRPPTACVHQLFEAQVDRTPAAIAVEQPGSKALSFRELDRRANRIAHRLRALGAGPGHPVAICLRRSIDAAVVPLAALKAGAAYVPLDPGHPPARRAFMIEQAAARIVVTEPALADLLDGDDETRPRAEVDPDDLAYIIYTSGSTGRPKGVAMPHRPLAGLIRWHLGDPELSRPLRTLQFAPLGFDVSFQEMLTTWCTGGTLVVVDDDVRRDPERLLGAILDAGIERLFVPPVVLAQLAEVAARAPTLPARLREIITAGEPLVITPAIQAFIERIEGCAIRNQYGPTETHVVTEHVLGGRPAIWPATPPIGRPITGARVYLLDADMQLVPAGITGELYLGGDAVARGYAGRAALTAERFVPDPFSQPPGGRLYRTGDLARYLPDGAIQFLGRADHQVKIRGFRIECGEVEAVLGEHAAVRQAAVVALDDASGQRFLAGYVVPQPGVVLTDDQLRQFLRDRLPDYMIPSAFVALDALPLSSNGKLDRAALPAPGDRRIAAARTGVAPRSALEATIAAIWCEVLHVQEIGVHDSFFDLGGHSLLATQIMSRVRDAFDIDIPLRRLFEPPSTVADLAVAVVQGRARMLDPADVTALIDDVERS